MKLEVHITNKNFYLLLTTIIILLTLLSVGAFNSGGPPSTLGHTGEELQVTISGTPMSLQNAINTGQLGTGGAGFTNEQIITTTGPWLIPPGITRIEITAVGGGGGGASSLEGAGGGGGGTLIDIGPGRIIITADGGSGGDPPAPLPAVRGGMGGRNGGIGTRGGSATLPSQIDGQGGDNQGNGGAGGISLTPGCNGGMGGMTGMNGQDPQRMPIIQANQDYSGWGGNAWGRGGTGAGSGPIIPLQQGINEDYGGGMTGGAGGITTQLINLQPTDQVIIQAIGGGGGGGAWANTNPQWVGCGGGGAGGAVIIRY